MSTNSAGTFRLNGTLLKEDTLVDAIQECEASANVQDSSLVPVPKTAFSKNPSLVAILQRFTEYVFIQKPIDHADPMPKAVPYVETHYTKGINLLTVSDYPVSATHFSESYKKEEKQGFRHALNQIRIKRCQDSLRNPLTGLTDTVEEIAGEDRNYFTLKMHGGMHMGKHRSYRSQSPEIRLEMHEKGRSTPIRLSHRRLIKIQ